MPRSVNKKIPNLDYNTFDHNGLEDASGIIKLFKSKNRRVMNIFPDEEERKNSEKTNDHESYGLLAHESNRLSKANGGTASTSSEKENNPHMRALSPVSIHAGSQEEITEQRPQFAKVVVLDNLSLRRSLFQNDRLKLNSNEITCSTPMANNRPSNSFLQNNLSPIRDSDTNLDGIEKIPVAKNHELKISNVETLADMENDLRNQFQIHPKTPVRKSRARSQYSEPARHTTPKKSLQKNPASLSGLRMSPMVVIEPMEISRASVQNYKHSQMRRLSVSKCNKTDMRSMNIVEETPPIRPSGSSKSSKSATRDEVLIKKLQLCDTSNSLMTEDGDEVENDAIVPQSSPPRTIANRFFKSKTQDNFDSSSMNSSSKKIVSDAVIQSFRDLHRKTLINDARRLSSSSHSNTDNQSCRVNIPKKSRPKPRQASEKTKAIEEYLKLGNRKRKSKKDLEDNKSKKRTLYSQRSFEEEEEISQKTTRNSSAKVKTIFHNNDLIESSDFDTVEDVNMEVLNNLRKRHSDVEHVFIKPKKPGPLKTKVKQNAHIKKVQLTETPKTSRSSAGTLKKTLEVQNQESSDDDDDDEQYVEEEVEISAENSRSPLKSLRSTRTRTQEMSNEEEQTEVSEEEEPSPPKSKKNKKARVSTPERTVESDDNNEEEEEEDLVVYTPPPPAHKRSKSKQKTREPSVSESEEEEYSPPCPASKKPRTKQKTRDPSPVVSEDSEEEEEESRQESPPARNTKSSQRARESSNINESEEEEEEEEYMPPSPARKSSKKIREPSPDIRSESEEELQVEKSPPREKSKTKKKKAPVNEVVDLPQPPPSRKPKTKTRIRQPSPETSASEEVEVERVSKKPQKRKAADDIGEGTAKKPRRRAIYDDEGFESDENSDKDFDVIYVPQNERYRLRKRRYARPWWWNGAPSNMRITHDGFSKEERKAEKQIALLKKKKHIDPLQALRGPGVMFLAPTEKLKQLKQIQREREVTRGLSEPPESRFKPLTKRGRPRKDQMQTVDEEEIESASVGTGTSMQSTLPTPSESIAHAIRHFNKNIDESLPTRTIEKSVSYDISHLNRLDWVDCANGVCFFAFFGTTGDGMLKLIPGSIKQRARTKNATMKFFVICGEVTFVINNEEKVIKDFGFVVVKPGNYYEIINNSNSDVIINFVRVSMGEDDEKKE